MIQQHFQILGKMFRRFANTFAPLNSIGNDFDEYQRDSVYRHTIATNAPWKPNLTTVITTTIREQTWVTQRNQRNGRDVVVIHYRTISLAINDLACHTLNATLMHLAAISRRPARGDGLGWFKV